jgi:hypothetical protein
MDPLTALSVASTIVQFVDFGTKLLFHSNELYKSSMGTLHSNNELELVTTDLRGLVTKLRQSCRSESDVQVSSSDDEQRRGFEKLYNEVVKLAKDLVERLKKLKVKDGRHRMWQSLKQAVETAWSEKKIAKMKVRLSSFRDALETRVLFSIRYAIVLICWRH